MAALAYLLNLDAERELADPKHYRTSPAVAARITALRPRLQLLSAEDRVIGIDEVAGCTAVAFCPTPRALASIRDAGLTAPPAPSLEVLRRVNARSFCAQLGQTLPRARYVRSMEALHAALSPDIVRLLKRDFGFAGRERRQVRDGVLDASTEGFARRSFARGEGLQVEPWLPIELELAQHVYLKPHGQTLLAAPRLQRCDAQGSWLASEELDPGTLTSDKRTQLEASTRLVCQALREAGYFGPLAIDAYRYRTAAGSSFQPRSKINARLSMGYPRALLLAGLED